MKSARASRLIVGFIIGALALAAACSSGIPLGGKCGVGQDAGCESGLLCCYHQIPGDTCDDPDSGHCANVPG